MQWDKKDAFGYTEEDEKFTWWEYAAIIASLPFLLVFAVAAEIGSAIFRAAEWALHKRRVIYTAAIAFALSMIWIWAVSAMNGM